MVVIDHHEFLCVEERRLKEDRERTKYWKRWGPYVAERQWATVREDYSDNGDAWSHFPHEHARFRTFRWGEDGIAGVSDTHGFQNIAFAFWNEEEYAPCRPSPSEPADGLVISSKRDSLAYQIRRGTMVKASKKHIFISTTLLR